MLQTLLQILWGIAEESHIAAKGAVDLVKTLYANNDPHCTGEACGLCGGKQPPYTMTITALTGFHAT